MSHISEDKLLMYLDGALSEAAAADAARHLSRCAACRAILADHLAIEEALHTMPALRPVVVTRSRPGAFRRLRLGVAAAALIATLGATWGINFTGYWRGVQAERLAMRRDHYSLVSAEASLLGEEAQR